MNLIRPVALLALALAAQAQAQAIGQPASTNLMFFQRFVAGEIPVREIVWRTRGLPPMSHHPAQGWVIWRSGWVTNSAFTERNEPKESGAAEVMEAMGASLTQFWHTRPDLVEIVDRNRSEPGFLGVTSGPLHFGHWGIFLASIGRSLGLPPMKPETVQWHPDGRFEAVAFQFLGERFDPFPVSGRFARLSDAGPLEIQFQTGTNAQIKRVEFTYGTNFGVALPERIVKFEGSNPATPTGEIIIERVNLDVSELSPDGFTSWMFTRPGWNTNVMTWTNSTSYYGPGSPGETHFMPSVERVRREWIRILQRFW